MMLFGLGIIHRNQSKFHIILFALAAIGHNRFS
jgi:hypothetical protein